jgi:coenzyme F420-reducing hydrogenase beta subunit
MNVCPKGCIDMKHDKYGVLRPVIDNEQCVNCNACQKVCPANNRLELGEPKKAYAAWHLDKEKRKYSASGGAATAFYETVIEQGGICFGTSFDENLNLNIVSTDNLEELKKFRGSKYVQASVGYSYKEAKRYLDDGRKVIYIGTPCQIAGLKNYLRKDYEQLITVDLVCHGVPSIKYLQSHISNIEKKIDKEVDNVTFRGEYSFELSLYKNERLVYKKYRFLDEYFTGFLNGLFYRENCYSCPYAQEKRVSDITIGDFWGLGREKPCDYTLEGGVSVILPITEKGREFFQAVNKKLFIDERPVSEAVNGNSQLREPSRKNERYDEFKQMYTSFGFETAVRKCTSKDIAVYKREAALKRVRGIAGGLKRKIIKHQ